jgi:choline dehydrogenase-like flavoprotein
MNDELTPQERLLRGALVVLAIQDLAYIVGYFIGGFTGHGEFPFVANSVTKDGFFLALALIAIQNIRRFAWLTLLIIMGHALLVVSLLVMIIAGQTSELGALDVGVKIDPTLVAWLWMGVNVVIVVVLTRIYTNAMRARYGVVFLSPYAFETLSALADILLPPGERRVEPDDVARNVDEYLSDYPAEGKGRIKWALRGMTAYPLLTLKPPFSAMEREQRRTFMEKRFMAEGSWSLARWWRRNLQLMMGAACQLVYMGYYSDPAVDASVGYQRFEQRPRAPALLAGAAAPASVDVEELDEGIDVLEADVVIVGSGAAGAILAYRLAAQDKTVIVLERGQHVEPANFSDRETTMLAHLYSDGAIQLSRDLRFAVLQGMCVGGSTVVNNAVCFDLPLATLNQWNDPQTYDAGIDKAAFYGAMVQVKNWLSVTNQAATRFTGAADAFNAGAAAYGGGTVVEANIENCFGCGYCNIGCKYGKKLSMLDSVLPWAQQDFPGKVRVIPECRADRIRFTGSHADSVVGKLAGGGQVEVRAEQRIIVCAGAIGSSLLLQRSGAGNARVGKYLSFNMATPLTADFGSLAPGYPALYPPPYDGLQISHYVDGPGGEDYVMETWFNPPATQSLFMPGWFEDHFDNMSNYRNVGSAGAVVGTRRNGSVWPRMTGNFSFKPHQDDVDLIVQALKRVGRIYFAAGAKRVMPATFKYHSFSTPAELDEGLERYAHDRTGLFLNSAHPQGGNVLSADQTKGVVDPSNFKVYGFDNLHVCDASVFPSSITVNPQLTVMTLAYYASSRLNA